MDTKQCCSKWIMPIKNALIYSSHNGKSNRNPTFLGHLLLSAILLLFFLSCDYLASTSAKRKQARWLNVPDPRFEFSVDENSNLDNDPNTLINTILADYKAEPHQKEVLKKYYSEILIRKYIHANILAYSFIRSYVTIIIIAISAFLMLSSSFFISREGWEKVNNAAINIFMISTAIVFVYTSLMIALKYEENVEKNGNDFIEYVNFSNEFLGFLATNRSREGQEISVEDFIIYADLRLQKLSGIGVDLDPSEVLKYKQNVDDTLSSPSNEQDSSLRDDSQGN